MFKYLLAAIAVMFSVSANAADVELKTKMDGSGTYIYYSGETKTSDPYKIERVLIEAAEHELPFLNTIVMNGNGGSAKAALEIADIIREREMMTIANHDCISACSLMWMSGGIDNRYLFGDAAKIRFHFAYTRDHRALNNMKEQVGWIGSQDHISKSSHYYTAQLLRYNVVDPALFVWNLSYYGGANTFYDVTAETLNEVVGGKVYEDVQANQE